MAYADMDDLRVPRLWVSAAGLAPVAARPGACYAILNATATAVISGLLEGNPKVIMRWPSQTRIRE